MAAAAARGITGVVDLEMPSSFRQWPNRFANGLDLVRVRASVYPDALDGLLAAGIRTGDPLAGDGDLLTMGPFKVISDGSLNTRTARCCDPYPDSDGRHLTRGTQNYDLDEMTALLSTAHAGGLEIALHAIGDAAVDLGCRRSRRPARRVGSSMPNWCASRTSPGWRGSVCRASVQPAHLLDDRDTTQRLSGDRADRCFALRSMVDAGVVLALGSDAPVAPLDPWLAMAAAVHRSADGREPVEPRRVAHPGRGAGREHRRSADARCGQSRRRRVTRHQSSWYRCRLRRGGRSAPRYAGRRHAARRSPHPLDAVGVRRAGRRRVTVGE